MDPDESWKHRLSSLSSSRRYQSRSDLFLGGHEGNEMDEGSKVEFLCPFCGEEFDVVGLCCHMDEGHPAEVKDGVCPVCMKRLGVDMVGHLTMQHGSFLKVHRRRKFHKGGSNTTFSMLRKELRDGNLRSLFGGGSSCIVSSSTEADPLLSSFMSNLSLDDEPVKPLARSSNKETARSAKESTNANSSRRNVQRTALSGEEEEEKARKCEFVQGLLMSTILDES